MRTLGVITVGIGISLSMGALGGCSISSADPTGDTVSDHNAAVDLGSSRPSLLGINIDPKNGAANPSPDDLGALGATRVRVEFKVDTDAAKSPDEELQGAFDQYDGTLKNMAGRGITVLLIVDYASLSRDRYGAWDSPGFAGAFTSRAGSIAAHYQGTIDHFEIWNEEDLCEGDYCPEISADTFATLLGGAAKAIHGASPGARVASGGLASGKWETYLGDVISRMGDSWNDVNAVGAHPYTFWPAAAGAGGNVLEYQVGRLRDIGNKPLWFTEWGDGGNQYQLMQAYFDFFANTGIKESNMVEEAYLFAWSDTQQGGGTAFGVLNAKGEQKPEYGLFHGVATGGTSNPPAPDPGQGQASACSAVASQKGWEGGICGAGACQGVSGEATSDCDVCCAGTSRLHGGIVAGGAGVPGILVSVWGQRDQDYHETTTDDGGVFSFDGLNPTSPYNMVVNAKFDGGQFVTVDPNHDQATRDNISLASGPDGFHGENFSLGY